MNNYGDQGSVPLITFSLSRAQGDRHGVRLILAIATINTSNISITDTIPTLQYSTLNLVCFIAYPAEIQTELRTRFCIPCKTLPEISGISYPTGVKSKLILGHKIPTGVWSAPNLRHIIPPWSMTYHIFCAYLWAIFPNHQIVSGASDVVCR